MAGWEFKVAGGGTGVVIGLGTAAVVGGLVLYATSGRKPHPTPEPVAAPVSHKAPATQLPNDRGPLRPELLAEADGADPVSGAPVDAPIGTRLGPRPSASAALHAEDPAAQPEAFDPFAGLPPAAAVAGIPPVNSIAGQDYVSARFDPDEGVDITSDDGVRVRIRPGTLVDAHGQPAEGPVTVSFTYIHDKEQVARMPVQLRTRRGPRPMLLESFGMVDLSLTSPSGLVDLSEPAELSFPLAGAPTYADGAEASLYKMNEVSDRWDRAGTGTVQNGRFVAQVRSRGTWNCDEPIDNTGCVVGRLVAEEPFELPRDTLVTMEGAERLWRAQNVPAADGNFCIEGAPASPAHLDAVTRYGSDCFETVRVTKAEVSEAGASCELGYHRCTPVEIHVRKAECAGPFEPMNQRETFAAFDIAVPESVQGVQIVCGPLFRVGLTPEDGHVHHARIPTDRRCHADLDLGHVAYRMERVNGGQTWTCTQQGKDFSCEGPPRGQVDPSLLANREVIEILPPGSPYSWTGGE